MPQAKRWSLRAAAGPYREFDTAIRQDRRASRPRSGRGHQECDLLRGPVRYTSEQWLRFAGRSIPLKERTPVPVRAMLNAINPRTFSRWQISRPSSGVIRASAGLPMSWSTEPIRARGKTLKCCDCSRLTMNAVRKASSSWGSPVPFSKSETSTESRDANEKAGRPCVSQTARPADNQQRHAQWYPQSSGGCAFSR